MEEKQMKVYIDRIKEYDPALLDSYFSNVITAEGVIERLKKAERVILKPNLLGSHPPEAAVTTHPAVVESVIRTLQEAGIKNILLGDSPGGTYRTEDVYKETGMHDVAQRCGIKLLNFGRNGVDCIERDGYKLKIDSGMLRDVAIINIAKYKTHSLTMFTGAVKNLFGTVPGLIKSDYHREYPDPANLAALIVAIYQEIKPRLVLNIIDGIWGMEGEGPSAGKARNFGVMFASVSASALDYTAASLMGLEGRRVDTIRLSMQADGITPSDIEVGDEWRTFRFRKMKISRASRYSVFINRIPKFMQQWFHRLYDYRLTFNDRCRLCRICEESCPVKAIAIPEGALIPEIDYSKCIKCMCCHEFCPYKAVYIKKTFLAKLLLR